MLPVLTGNDRLMSPGIARLLRHHPVASGATETTALVAILQIDIATSSFGAVSAEPAKATLVDESQVAVIG